MKSRILIIIISSLLFTSVIGSSFAAEPIVKIGGSEIEVLLDGRKMQFPDARPFVDENSRTLVPIRFISESLGAQVYWNGKEEKVTITQGSTKIELWIGKSEALINGQTFAFDTKMIVKDQRTFVPLRFVSEALGQVVEWDQVGSWVWIGEKTIPTIQEITNAVPIDDYVEMFGTKDDLMKDSLKNPFDSIRIFDLEQLPLKIEHESGRDTIIYDIYIIKQGDLSGLQIRHSDYGSFYTHYIIPDSTPRSRGKISGMYIKHGDGTATSTYRIVENSDKTFDGIEDYKNLTIGDITFIGLDVDGDSVTWLDNPWRE